MRVSGSPAFAGTPPLVHRCTSGGMAGGPVAVDLSGHRETALRKSPTSESPVHLFSRLILSSRATLSRRRLCPASIFPNSTVRKNGTR